jgi:hypothetical protein
LYATLELVVEDEIRCERGRCWIGIVECEVLDADYITARVNNQSARVFDLPRQRHRIDHASHCRQDNAVVYQGIAVKIRDCCAQASQAIDERGAKLERRSAAGDRRGRTLRLPHGGHTAKRNEKSSFTQELIHVFDLGMIAKLLTLLEVRTIK